MVKRLTQEDVNNLYRSLNNKSNEKDVENAWRSIFKSYFVDKNSDGNGRINSPYNVDGFIVEDRMVFALRILLEFKDGTDLQNIYDRARITIQCIYYMKIFSEKNIEIPNVIVGADSNQAFVLYAPNFYKYLKYESIDWNIAPSQAYKRNPEIMNELINDSNLSVFVYNLNVSKNIKQRYETIKNLFDEVDSLGGFDPQTGEEFKVDVNESNLAVLFDDFVRISFKSLKESDSISPVDMVNIFQQLLLGRNPDEYYQLPNNSNKLHLPGDKKIDINGSDMSAFFKHFNRNLNNKEQDALISISDRLIEDITRRRKGDYWTPTIWANKAISLIDSTLNKKWKTKEKVIINDWKKDCIVWDCSSGAKNLTRDYHFNNLFSSTIHQSELDLANQYNSYPKTNYAFQYDFLNDDVEQLNILKSIDLNSMTQDELDEFSTHLKMPKSLFMNLVNNKPLVFYINPPFGTANNRKFSKKNENKTNMSKTAISALMKDSKIGKASQQLYAQFFYRIVEIIDIFQLSNVILASFSPYQFRTGGNYFDKFYKRFLKTLHPTDGFLFNSGEFSDVSTDWGISFGIYSNEKSFKFNENIKISEFNNDKIKNISNKRIRTIEDKNSISNWIKLGQNSGIMGKKLKTNEYTPVTSSIRTSSNYGRSSYYSNSIGYMYFIGNDIEHSDTAVSIFSSAFKSSNGININKYNLIKAVIGFSIRRSIDFHWYNGKDQFFIDDSISKQILDDDSFIFDCLIFSLTQYRASYQSSLGKNSIPKDFPEITNEWFYFPNKIMVNLYGKISNNDNLYGLFNEEYNRAKASSDSIIYRLLEKYGVKFKLNKNINNEDRIDYSFSLPNNISSEAENMIDTMVELFNKTWKFRTLAVSSNPEWSAERYDAGFNQMYRIMTNMVNDENWIHIYKNSYNNLKNKIKNKAKKLNIIN